ncbi:hypothetical protein LPW11_07695 [Geomonas sp. RF6]|nr:hypothetical protein [Geomonas sp. RF6]UFS72065.1 hypothetical protein LPW11_07695 [Geomonas sp. RF6]
MNTVLHKTAQGKIISEWAKNLECWNSFRESSFSSWKPAIPEAGRLRRGQ